MCDEEGSVTEAHNRRDFIAGVSATAAVVLLPQRIASAAEERLETTRIRLPRIGGVCTAPQYIADDLLRAEGFTDIGGVETTPGAPVLAAMARGDIDLGLNYVAPDILAVDAGEPITML